MFKILHNRNLFFQKIRLIVFKYPFINIPNSMKKVALWKMSLLYAKIPNNKYTNINVLLEINGLIGDFNKMDIKS